MSGAGARGPDAAESRLPEGVFWGDWAYKGGS